jgi:hypothetical protein
MDEGKIIEKLDEQNTLLRAIAELLKRYMEVKGVF